MNEKTLDDDFAKSMRDASVRERRSVMLRQPHVAPLTAWVQRLREKDSVEVPDFDPLDGGVGAQVLFLFEKPGPMTASEGRSGQIGSGFISRNNDDPTAAATFDFMQQAGIPRKLTVIWNVVPWWNGTRKLTRKELNDGAQIVSTLVSLLPDLRAVVMVGKRAHVLAQPYLETTRLKLFASAHPSPLVRARYPLRWGRIPSEWSQVCEFIGPGDAG